jgi:hypothetical protein
VTAPPPRGTVRFNECSSACVCVCVCVQMEVGTCPIRPCGWTGRLCRALPEISATAGYWPTLRQQEQSISRVQEVRLSRLRKTSHNGRYGETPSGRFSWGAQGVQRQDDQSLGIWKEAVA